MAQHSKRYLRKGPCYLRFTKRVAKVTKGMSADEAARIAQETEEAMRPYAISSMGLVYLPI